MRDCNSEVRCTVIIIIIIEGYLLINFEFKNAYTEGAALAGELWVDWSGWVQVINIVCICKHTATRMHMVGLPSWR